VKNELIYQQNQIATVTLRYFLYKPTKGFGEKRLRTSKIKGNTSEHKQMHRRGDFIASEKKQTHISKEPNLDSASQIYLSKWTRGFFKKHPKTFFNKGK